MAKKQSRRKRRLTSITSRRTLASVPKLTKRQKAANRYAAAAAAEAYREGQGVTEIYLHLDRAGNSIR